MITEHQLLKDLDSLHKKLIQRKFASQITEEEMLSFVYAKRIVQNLINVLNETNILYDNDETLNVDNECEPGYFDGKN